MTTKTRFFHVIRWLSLAAVGLAGLLIALAVRARVVRLPAADEPDDSPAFVPETPAPVPPAPDAAAVKPARRWLYLPLLAAGAVGLVVLQSAAPDAAAVLFGALLIMSAGAAGWQQRRRLLTALAQPAAKLRDLMQAGTGRAAAARAWARRHRVALAAALTLAALPLLLLSAWRFRLALNQADHFDVGLALAYLAAGGLALGTALSLRRDVVVQAVTVRLSMPAAVGRSNWFVTGAGVLALALVAEYNSHRFATYARFPMSTDTQFVLLVTGITLVIVGLGGPRSTGAALARLVSGGHSRRALLLLLAITLLGLGLRAWNLQDSMRFFVDEETFAAAVRRLQGDESIRLLSPVTGMAGFSFLFPYLQEQTAAAFGRSLYGLRMAGVLLGTLTIPAVYMLARALFDRKVALLAALLLATFPPHVHFSRLAISEVAGPLAGTLALAFGARGLRSGRRFDFAAAGALLGLTHYFHEGARIFYTPLFVLWVAGCILFARAGRPVPWRGLLTTALALVIVAAPIYTTLIAIDRPLFTRMVDNSSGLPGDYWQRLLEPGHLARHWRFHVVPSFLVYTNWTDSTLFYKGQYALVLPLLQPLLFLGTIISLRFWRVPGMALLLLCIASTSAGNTLMVNSAGSPRFVMAFPALALAFAVGLRYTLPLIGPLVTEGLRRWLPSAPKPRLRWALALLGLLAASAQVIYYYGEHVPVYNRQFRLAKYEPDGYDAALRSADFVPGTAVYFITPVEVNLIEAGGLIHLMREDLLVDSIPSRELTDTYLQEMPCGRDIAFYVRPDDAATLHILKTYFFLRAPERSPFADIIPDDRELLLYYAPYLPGMDQVYKRCSRG